MAKVSVIIPIYNIQNYLEQCLNSITNQTLKDLEIICINDCSIDKSIEILKKYAQKDKRIKIMDLHQNVGVAEARNIGLDNATGDYIYFLDGDDWIDNDYVEIMVKIFSEAKADIIINRRIKNIIKDKYEENEHTEMQKSIKDNVFIDIPKYVHSIFPVVWNKLYKRDFLKKYNIRFPQGYIHEDMFFHYVTFAYAKKVYIFSGSYYYYRKRAHSITSNVRSSTGTQIQVFELIYDYFKEKNFFDKKMKIFYIMPFYSICNEMTYNMFKKYFKKSGDYILKSGIYNNMEKMLCQNILNTKNYEDYITKFSSNIALSYVRSKR